MNDRIRRYHGIAICLHWVIAILILGMLVVGTYMVWLDESGPLRYSLTQWHKSFGIIALLLIAWRILWRLTHPPPTLPDHLQPWEKRAAGLTHVALYQLILAIPLSGWIMVSASPLALPTFLFDKIPWPHLPPFDKLPNKKDIALLFGDIHAIAGYLLMLLLVAHIGASLRHRFVLHDEVMARMSPKAADGRWIAGARSTFVAILFIIGGLVMYGYSGRDSVPLGAGNSKVRFGFTVQNQALEGSFGESTVEMLIDPDNPAANRLHATVNTAAVATGNSQVDSTLMGEDWFDPDNHPRAIFDSRELVRSDENSYSASGTLRIKGIARKLSFPVTLTYSDDKQVASGSFTVNRLDFNLGRDSQPDDETVAYPVTVKFEFEVR